MKFKLTIGDVVEFPVVGQINNGPTPARVSFKLQAKRLDVVAYRAALAEGNDTKTADFLAANLIGWSGQSIVMTGDDQPASFGPEALAALLSIVGMEGLILGAYIAALQISDTPKGRSGN